MICVRPGDWVVVTVTRMGRFRAGPSPFKSSHVSSVRLLLLRLAWDPGGGGGRDGGGAPAGREWKLSNLNLKPETRDRRDSESDS